MRRRVHKMPSIEEDIMNKNHAKNNNAYKDNSRVKSSGRKILKDMIEPSPGNSISKEKDYQIPKNYYLMKGII